MSEIFITTENVTKLLHSRVLHGPGLGPRAGPARNPWAGPGLNDILRAGPGAGLKFAGPGRAGLVNNNVAGCGPGLGITFPGLGRARAYSESHSCFNIMVKITLNHPLQ